MSGGPVLHLAEIVLWAHDMDRSLAFYRDLFGLEVISPPELPNRFLRASFQNCVTKKEKALHRNLTTSKRRQIH